MKPTLRIRRNIYSIFDFFNGKRRPLEALANMTLIFENRLSRPIVQCGSFVLYILVEVMFIA